jgi:argonaute-like protein implicated in RNA metabolism and viral defense
MDSIENLLLDIKESLEREIGALRQETREGFALVGKRLDRVEATMLHVDGRLTAMSRADIQTDQQMTELLARQHAQQQSIDDLYARIRKLEQPSQG